MGLAGFSVRYQEGLEVENMQNIFRTIGGLIISGGVTILAVKEYHYFQELTYQTAAQISADIRTIEGQNPELSPWLSIVIAAIILFGSIAIFSSGRR